MPDPRQQAPETHGGSVPIPLEALTSDDPELALVWADMHAWAEAHPCDCEAMCECEGGSDDD